MNAHAPNIEVETGISAVETSDGVWTVTVDGRTEDSRSVTRDGTSFIAWIGSRDVHWNFGRAVKACAEHVRFHRFLAAEAAQKRAQWLDDVAAISADARANMIAQLEADADALKYSGSETDYTGRVAAVHQQIAALKAVA